MDALTGKAKVLRGMVGVMSIGTGAEQEVHPWEDIEFQPEGIYLHHHDAYETITFFPMYTLRQMRLHQAEMEKHGRNYPRGEEAYRALNRSKTSLGRPDPASLPPGPVASEGNENDGEDEQNDDKIHA